MLQASPACSGRHPGAPGHAAPDLPGEPEHEPVRRVHVQGSDDTTPLIDITYQCRLDSAVEEDFVDCEYPQEYFTLAPG